VKRSLLILLILSFNLFGAFELQQLNSEIIGNGGICSLHPFGNNPAVFSTDHKISFTSNYTNLFGIKDLHCWDFGMHYNLNDNNSILIKSNSVGDKVYHENTFNIGYSWRLNIPVSIGISLSYYNLSVEKFETENSFGLSAGICYFLNEQVTMSTLFGNVNRPKICKNEELLPEYFAFGVKWQINRFFELNSELFKDTLYPFNSRFGTKVNLYRNIQFFTGIQTNPDRFSGGVAIQMFNIKFISSLQTHLKLPHTYYIGCQFYLK